MNLIIDAQLPPQLAVWIWEQFGVEACSAKYLGLHNAEGGQIFAEARRIEGIVRMRISSDCFTSWEVRPKFFGLPVVTLPIKKCAKYFFGG